MSSKMIENAVSAVPDCMMPDIFENRLFAKELYNPDCIDGQKKTIDLLHIGMNPFSTAIF